MLFQFYTFEELDTKTLYDILAHRSEVFLLEQKNIYCDIDGLDQNAVHLLATDHAGKIEGYARLFPARETLTEFSFSSFGRLSVRKDSRHQGLGKNLVLAACQWLFENSNCTVIQISAMAYLEDFYQKLGFDRTSEVFEIAHVPHVTMVLHKEISS